MLRVVTWVFYLNLTKISKVKVMRVIGIDPDANKHGISLFENGALVNLYNLELFGLYELITWELSGNVDLISIENVCGNNSLFRKSANEETQVSIGRRLGMVQQSQTEIERMCAYLEIPIIRNKISSIWKNQAGKKQFQAVTGWKGKSNEDTRSAAYFGWLHAKKI